MHPESLWRDLVVAARRLRRTPIFTIFAAVSLALGVGATSAVYSAVYSLMWRPTGVQDADRVVVLTRFIQSTGRAGWQDAVWRQDLEVVGGLSASCDRTAASARLALTLADAAMTELVQGEAVTGEYFRTLGVGAALGRTVQPADDDPSRPAVIVVSHRLWRTRLAADVSAIGRVVRVNGRPFEIVGVVAESFTGLGSTLTARTDVWLPVSAVPSGRLASFSVVGRLRDGRAVSDAAGEFALAGSRLDAVLSAVGAAAPAGVVVERQWSAMAYSDAMVEIPGLPVGTIVMALVGLVLAIACANLANLVVGRGVSRWHELAVRRALGASRWRLIREQLAESAILAILGAAGAYIVVRALLVAFAVELPVSRFQIVQLDPQLNVPTLVAAAVALLAALLVIGLLPAWQLTRQEVRPLMTSDAGGVGQRWWRGQKRSIACQVAMSLGLLLIAVVCIRAVADEARHDSGVDIDRLAVGYLRGLAGWVPDRTRAAVDALIVAVRQQHGVEDVAVSSGLPFGTMNYAVSITTPGRPFGVGRADINSPLIAATPSIFRVTGISIVRGRAFDERDVEGAQAVVVLSEHSARRLFNSSEAVGREIQIRDWPPRPDHVVSTAVIIGVASDTDVSRLFLRNNGALYVPLAQRLQPMTVVARTAGDPAALMEPLRVAARLADPELAIGPGSGPGRVVLASAHVNIGILAALIGSLGVLALVLSMAGLYGVLSHVTARRTREMGLRMALGAGRGQIIRLVIDDGLQPVLVGLASGFVFATLVRFALNLQYPGVVALVEPITSILASLPLLLAALLACYLPARRAARAEPNVALRDQ